MAPRHFTLHNKNQPCMGLQAQRATRVLCRLLSFKRAAPSAVKLAGDEMGRSTAHHLSPLPTLWLSHEFTQGKKKQLRTDTTKPNKST